MLFTESIGEPFQSCCPHSVDQVARCIWRASIPSTHSGNTSDRGNPLRH